MSNTTKTTIGVGVEDRASAALKILSQNIKGVDSSVEKLKGSMGKLSPVFSQLSSVASTVGLAALGKSAIDSAANIGRLSQQLGISTETLSTYKYIAEQSNIPFEVLSKTLGGIVKRVGDASKGTGEATAVLQELGLNAKRLSQQAPEQQFLAIADAMKKVKNPTDAVRMAMKLAGEEGAKPFLTVIKDGAAGIQAFSKDAKDAGAIITTAMSQKAIEAQQSIARLKAELMGVVTALAIDFIPLLQQTVSKLSSLVEKYKELDPQSKNFLNTTVAMGIAIPIVISVISNFVNVVKGAGVAFVAIKAFLSGGGLVAGLTNPVTATILAVAAAIGILLVAINKVNANKIKIQVEKDAAASEALGTYALTNMGQPSGNKQLDAVVDGMKRTRNDIRTLEKSSSDQVRQAASKHLGLESLFTYKADEAGRMIKEFKDDTTLIGELGNHYVKEQAELVAKTYTPEFLVNLTKMNEDLSAAGMSTVSIYETIANETTGVLETSLKDKKSVMSQMIASQDALDAKLADKPSQLFLDGVNELNDAILKYGNGVVEVINPMNQWIDAQGKIHSEMKSETALLVEYNEAWKRLKKTYEDANSAKAAAIAADAKMFGVPTTQGAYDSNGVWNKNAPRNPADIATDTASARNAITPIGPYGQEVKGATADELSKIAEWQKTIEGQFYTIAGAGQSAASLIAESFMSMADGVSGVLGDTIGTYFDNIMKKGEDTKIMVGDAFREMAVGMVKNLATVVIKMLLVNLIAKALGFSVGKIPIGAITGNMTLAGKAAGGDVNMGQPYIVGEKGQELFIPNTAGRIIPNNKLGSKTSTTHVQNHITVAVEGVSIDSPLVLRRVAEKLNDELIKVRSTYYDSRVAVAAA